MDPSAGWFAVSAPSSISRRITALAYGHPGSAVVRRRKGSPRIAVWPRIRIPSCAPENSTRRSPSGLAPCRDLKRAQRGLLVLEPRVLLRPACHLHDDVGAIVVVGEQQEDRLVRCVESRDRHGPPAILDRETRSRRDPPQVLRRSGQPLSSEELGGVSLDPEAPPGPSSNARRCAADAPAAVRTQGACGIHSDGVRSRGCPSEISLGRPDPQALPSQSGERVGREERAAGCVRGALHERDGVLRHRPLDGSSDTGIADGGCAPISEDDHRLHLVIRRRGQISGDRRRATSADEGPDRRFGDREHVGPSPFRPWRRSRAGRGQKPSRR